MLHVSLERRKPIARVSDRRRSKNEHLARVRQLVLGRDRGCRFWAAYEAAGRPPAVLVEGRPPTACRGGLHAHHMRRRSQGGPDTMNNLVTLCAGHHGWVHDHPAFARMIGLLR